MVSMQAYVGGNSDDRGRRGVVIRFVYTHTYKHTHTHAYTYAYIHVLPANQLFLYQRVDSSKMNSIASKSRSKQPYFLSA